MIDCNLVNAQIRYAHVLFPTDNTDFLYFHHPDKTIRFFAPQKSLYGFTQILTRFARYGRSNQASLQIIHPTH